MHTCERCGYTTSVKASYTRHQNRKRQCMPNDEVDKEPTNNTHNSIHTPTKRIECDSTRQINHTLNTVHHETINRYFVFNCFSILDNRFMMEFAASKIFNDILNLFPGNTPDEPYVLNPRDLTEIILLKYPDRQGLEQIL